MKKDQVFLFLTHIYSEEIYGEFEKIRRATRTLGDCFLLYQQKPGTTVDSRLLTLPHYIQTDQDLRTLSDAPYFSDSPECFKPDRSLIKFSREHKYEYYWLIEYDVRFSGEWEYFFRYFSESAEDLLTSHIRRYSQEPDWFFWRLDGFDKKIDLAKALRSFNPVFRISAPALEYVYRMYLKGWTGIYEALIPTLLFHGNFTLRDFGGTGDFVLPQDIDRFYLDSSDCALADGKTMRFRPPHGSLAGYPENKLIHPVKPRQRGENFMQEAAEAVKPVSVIIPTYNCGAYIKEALDSVFAQTFRDLEVIVVDDGSTDNTREVVGRFGRQVRYVFQENQGVSAARNTGIKNAQGRYIAFLDADDVWLPGKLELQLRAIEESDSIGAVACGLFCIRENATIEKEVIPGGHPGKDRLIRELCCDPGIFFGAGSAILVRKECFLKLGPFDEQLRGAEDWEMCLRIAKSYEVRSVQLPLLEYRARNGSAVSGRNAEQFLTQELRFVRKVFQSGDLKWRLLLKARAYSQRYLRAVGACDAAGRPEEAKKHLLRAVCIYPPVLLRKPIRDRYLSFMPGRAPYQRFKNRARRLAALLNYKKPLKELVADLRSLIIRKMNKRKELIIVVPFRDREGDLEQFIPHMRHFLKDVKHRIVVVEQTGEGLFNRAKLLNAGFSLYRDANAYFCFHDVDMLPESALCDYSYPVAPTHLSAYCSQFGYQYDPYCFGGVLLVNKKDFRSVNGFSNQYWGWGAEDDDLRKRFDLTRTIIRTRRMGRYRSIERLAFGHPRAHENVKRSGNPHYQKNCLRLGSGEGLPYDPKTDGLSDLKFELLKTVTGDGFVRHLVRL